MEELKNAIEEISKEKIIKVVIIIIVNATVNLKDRINFYNIGCNVQLIFCKICISICFLLKKCINNDIM